MSVRGGPGRYLQPRMHDRATTPPNGLLEWGCTHVQPPQQQASSSCRGQLVHDNPLTLKPTTTSSSRPIAQESKLEKHAGTRWVGCGDPGETAAKCEHLNNSGATCQGSLALACAPLGGVPLTLAGGRWTGSGALNGPGSGSLHRNRFSFCLLGGSGGGHAQSCSLGGPPTHKTAGLPLAYGAARTAAAGTPAHK